MIHYGKECKLCKATSPKNINNTVDTSHILLKGKILIIYNFIVIIVLIPWSFPEFGFCKMTKYACAVCV